MTDEELKRYYAEGKDSWLKSTISMEDIQDNIGLKNLVIRRTYQYDESTANKPIVKLFNFKDSPEGLEFWYRIVTGEFDYYYTVYERQNNDNIRT